MPTDTQSLLEDPPGETAQDQDSGAAAQDDVFAPTVGDDVFVGGAGNDVLSGGEGNDILRGDGDPGAGTVRIAAFGDSLINYGQSFSPEEEFPNQLQEALARDGVNADVLNFGVGGERSVDAVSRLDSVIAAEPQVAIVEFGTNDALRFVSTERVHDALDQIVGQLTASGIQVVLAGAYATYENDGQQHGYSDPADIAAFEAIFPNVATKYGAILYPQFLDGVREDPALGLGDGIHANPAGIAHVAENILPAVEHALGRLGPVGDDTLEGGEGDDRLDGGLGNDSLAGGSGDDRLSGGGGHDVFHFEAGDGVDTITDFGGAGAGAMTSGDEDLIAFGPGLTADAMTMTQVGNDVVIAFGDTSENGSDNNESDNAADQVVLRNTRLEAVVDESGHPVEFLLDGEEVPKDWADRFGDGTGGDAPKPPETPPADDTDTSSPDDNGDASQRDDGTDAAQKDEETDTTQKDDNTDTSSPDDEGDSVLPDDQVSDDGANSRDGEAAHNGAHDDALLWGVEQPNPEDPLG